MAMRSDLVHNIGEFLTAPDVRSRHQQRFNAQTWRNLRGASTPAETLIKELLKVEDALKELKGKLPQQQVTEGYQALNDLREFLGLPPVSQD